VFDGLEQLDERIITVLDAPDRLIEMDVTEIRDRERKKSTYGEKDSESRMYCLRRGNLL
jgi:hypothetical protein